MQILYLIGNGFDLNLGLRTSYQDFYRYYKETPSNSSLIKRLKEDIGTDYENWADLELGLGKYTEKIKSIDELDEVYDDLTDNLSYYLEEIRKKFSIDNFNRKKFIDDIKNPEKYLTEKDKIEVVDFIKKFNGHMYIKCVTFNYTKFFDYFFGENNSENVDIGITHNNKHSIYLSDIYHIHGYTDKRMILGVDNISQIPNQEFHQNIDARETLIKSECNQSIKETVDDKCKELIENTDLFCIFGSSIGDTDKLWWDLIGNQLLSYDCKLIIFHYADQRKRRNTRYIPRIERAIRQRFLNKLDLTDEEKEIVGKRIFVAIDTDIFNIHQELKTIAPPSIT